MDESTNWFVDLDAPNPSIRKFVISSITSFTI